MRKIKLTVLSALVPLLTATPAVAAAAAEPASSANSVVVPPDAHVHGKTYGDWSASWWQYVDSVPKATNPLFDQTGANCGVQQSGPVFYLGGVYGPQGTVSVHRTQCHVPAGKFLFFPIINTFCGEPDYWVDYCQNPVDQATDLSAEVDGKEISGLGTGTTTRYRAQAHGFGYTAPADNIFDVPGPFTHDPNLGADGVYLMLKPLSRGCHTIHFRGNMSLWNLNLDVTYNLTVDA